MIQRKPITPDAARLRMADLCARAEHCESEIRDKLRRLPLRSREAEEIIDFLVDQGFIDDARYARSYANDKMRFSGWGRLKIRMGLIAKRIDREEIADALDSLDEEEYKAVAERVARAKAKSLDLSDYDGRNKLYRHLLSRGFESKIASMQIRNLSQE